MKVDFFLRNTYKEMAAFWNQELFFSLINLGVTVMSLQTLQLGGMIVPGIHHSMMECMLGT
jgi:hypothetical protein